MYLHVVKQKLKEWRPFRALHTKKKSNPDVEAPIFSLDSRLTDGGKVVSLTRRPHFTLQEDSWYSFSLEAESTLGP
jgi:hypothetical protein